MLNKNIEEKIFLEINNYKINISIKEDNIYLEIESNNNNNIIYYNEYSLKSLKYNHLFEKYNKIQEIYEFLYQIIENSINNQVKIEEYETIFIFKIVFKIKFKSEIITFNIDKNNKYEKKDDSIFKNNLNNFENILKEIENDMNNLDPYIKKLKDENEKITEENTKLKKEIEVLMVENENLKQELNNKINSKIENSNKEMIKNENENKVQREIQKPQQEKKIFNKKKSIDNLIYKNDNNQERIKFDGENKILKDENQKTNKELKKSESIKNKGNIFSKDLEKQLSNFIKESETYKKKVISFKLLYKASIDNDSASSFHNKVDNQGPILIIIKTNSDKIIGGFSSKSWSSNNEYIEDKEAFLFFSYFVYSKYKIKFENRDKACLHNKDEGPHFGLNALVVSNNCLKNESCCATDTYKLSGINLMGKKGYSKFKIKDYEVYKVIFEQ